jgi:hypothetical protein
VRPGDGQPEPVEPGPHVGRRDAEQPGELDPRVADRGDPVEDAEEVVLGQAPQGVELERDVAGGQGRFGEAMGTSL